MRGPANWVERSRLCHAVVERAGARLPHPKFIADAPVPLSEMGALPGGVLQVLILKSLWAR